MVRIDSLMKGDKFTDVQRLHYTFERPDHALSGCVWAVREDGKVDCFARSALVFQGWI